jgi:hypothetical protein
VRRVKVDDNIFRYLDTNGDGTGTKNANGDYSSAAERFLITPPVGQTYFLNRMIIQVYDTTGMQAQEYGSLTSELSNGIYLRVRDPSDAVKLDLTDGIPIVKNSDWGGLCYDVDVKTWGSGNEALVVRWTFANAGNPLVLPSGWSLNVELNDNLDGLIEHLFIIQGWRDD